jgi:uncharacterized membrane protein YciS (DUF1049 family)
MEYSFIAMGLSPSIIFAILFLLGVMAFILGLVWLAYKLSTWLSQRKFFIQSRQRREARRMAQAKKRKLSFGALWGEALTGPVILTIAVVMLYDHFKGIWDISPDIATFWTRINESTRTNVLVAIFFVVALLLWMLVLVSRYTREAQRDKAFEELLKTNSNELKESLKTNSEQMGQIAEGIKALAEEIRKDREDRHG